MPGGWLPKKFNLKDCQHPETDSNLLTTTYYNLKNIYKTDIWNNLGNI